MTFDLLLAKYQKMYNVYRNKGEEFSGNAKVRLLLKCISHSGLNGTIEILKVRIITSITAVSYTTVANRLSTVVSELLGYITNTLNISELSTNYSLVVYNNDGSINTRFHKK